jgi:hypothetical protein
LPSKVTLYAIGFDYLAEAVEHLLKREILSPGLLKKQGKGA